MLVAEAEPFLVAAAKAMEIDTLHQIDTGLDPVTAEREQWDDGNNTLAIAPRVAVAYERNIETNTRLEEAGIEVDRDRRLRARLRPRRPALHVLPDQPRPALRQLRDLSEIGLVPRIPDFERCLRRNARARPLLTGDATTAGRP